ncbi:antirestriction protein ArdA [Henriciella sp.]|uniref:antirestriction protein ArdA n=1 Tax=Henriciella sp. TaxID=1968823 RepID=UPI0025C3E9AE|nr:antirestriction protein ArdA [Henriciella sp.]
MANPIPTEVLKMRTTNDEIRIYVACLASYNDGILHGAWIDATQGLEGVWREVSAMLLRSPVEYAEEWAIHDYEGFGELHLSEYEGLDRVSEYAAFIEDHGALGAALLSERGDLEDAQKASDEQYAGQFRSLADFAEEITEETSEIPENLRFYIDYEAMARDLVINDVFTIQTGFEDIHVFWQR